MNLRVSFLFFLLLTLAITTLRGAESEPVRDKFVEAQLFSSHAKIAPGQTFQLGLKFTIDDTWHTYWSNPGETGKPTTLDLTLPEGFSASALKFPVPKRFVVDYSVPGVMELYEAGFGYEHSVVHVVDVTVPADAKAGESITISGKTTFLMCDPSECVPGQAELSITIPVAAESVTSTHAPVISLYATKVPKTVDWATEVSLEGEDVVVSIDVSEGQLPADAPLHFFPDKVHIFDQLDDPEITKTDGKLNFAFQKYADLKAAPEYISGIVIAETQTGKKGFHVSSGDAQEPKVTKSEPVGESPEAAPDTSTLPFGGGLFGALLGAFVGGIILNVMPCVFPVISLKVMSFVGQAGEDRKKIFAHSAVFTLGILIFFWALAAASVIVNKVFGLESSWGFQMQFPGYVLALIFIMAIVGLSLYGIFEIGTSMTGIGGELVTKEGYAGSFWSGALAVLLATPCTAPLMAPAITFAFAQPTPVLFAIFTALGLGMAAPYFLLALFPKLLDVIPPPGAWMETFKQFMAFPMFAVVIWLIGVLSKQLNVSGLQWALVAILLVGMAAWALGRFAGPERSKGARTKGRIIALIFFVLSIFVAVSATKKQAPYVPKNLVEKIERLRSEGKHVFVDFTAEWCATCKVNERATIKTEKVQNAFAENNIEFLIADWTNRDPEIAGILKEYGRSGVPLYLLYPADQSQKAIALPDGIVTAGMVFDAIEKVTGSQ